MSSYRKEATAHLRLRRAHFVEKHRAGIRRTQGGDVKCSGSKMKKSLALILLLFNANPVLAGSVPGQSASRVYVNAYPCLADHGRRAVEFSGAPIVTLYDRVHYGDADYNGLSPTVTVGKSENGESNFSFDVQPGNYHAFVRFSSSRSFFRNGPLIVISGHDRHLFVAGCGLADWHDVAAIAGRLPLSTVTVSVLVFDHPMQCGDDTRALDQKTLKLVANRQRTAAVVDDGIYYANFHSYGKQDRTIALAFSGALFTEGAILLTDTPEVPQASRRLSSKTLPPRSSRRQRGPRANWCAYPAFEQSHQLRRPVGLKAWCKRVDTCRPGGARCVGAKGAVVVHCDAQQEDKRERRFFEGGARSNASRLVGLRRA
jgi:hypothetical protein